MGRSFVVFTTKGSGVKDSAVKRCQVCGVPLKNSSGVRKMVSGFMEKNRYAVLKAPAANLYLS